MIVTPDPPASTQPAVTDGLPRLPPEVHAKLSRAVALVGGVDGVVVAFSGGVDSSVVAWIALHALGPRALAVTFDGPFLPRNEARHALDVAAEIGIRHRLEPVDLLTVYGFSRNLPDRCYLCKRHLLGRLARIARHEHLSTILSGTNADDDPGLRPGSRAEVEAGVRRPLAEVGLTKREIRTIAGALGLSVAQRPAAPCLATRFPVGERLTAEGMARVDAAEAELRALGFRELRVRCHGDVARIELRPADVARAARVRTRRDIDRRLAALGFRFVALDLRGLRSGSMSEASASSGAEAADGR